MLEDYVSRNKRSRALQRCHSTRDLSVASVFLQKRSAHGADGPRRISADFGSPGTIFHQIVEHGRHALKNLDPGVGARFRRMNQYPCAGFRLLRLRVIFDDKKWHQVYWRKSMVTTVAVSRISGVTRSRTLLLTRFRTLAILRQRGDRFGRVHFLAQSIGPGTAAAVGRIDRFLRRDEITAATLAA